MEQISVTIYDFNELPANVQNNVIENHRHENVSDGCWSELILDNWKEKLANMGFVNPNIMFSGFGCQGDGACFTCEEIDFMAYADHLIMQTNTYSEARWLRVFALLYDKGLASAKVVHEGRYYHENSTSLSSEVLCQSEDVYQRFISLVANIEECMVEISRAIYRDLEAEYFHLTADETVSESLMAGEIKFLESGDRWSN